MPRLGCTVWVQAMLACVSVGCADDVALEPEDTDATGDASTGTGGEIEEQRLEHHAWTSGEVGVYRHSFDTLLGIACTFATAVDGATRCLPKPEVSYESSDFPAFSDPDCSAPLVVVDSDSDEAMPAFGRRQVDEDSSCAGRWAVDALTRIPSDGTIYRKQPTGCFPREASDEEYYAPTPRDPDEFVRAAQEAEVDDQGIGMEVWVGSDGSRLATGPWDARYGPVRAQELAAPAGEHFVPTSVGRAGGFYADSACTQPVFRPSTCQTAPVRALLEQGMDSGISVLHPGPEIDPADAWVGSGDRCMPWHTEAQDGASFFARGEPFESSELAPVERMLVGTGPVRRRALLSPSGAVIGVEEPPFSVDGVSCSPVSGWAPDEARCIPEVVRTLDVSSIGAFADPGCSSPLVDLPELSVGALVLDDTGASQSDVPLADVWVVQNAAKGSDAYLRGSNDQCFPEAFDTTGLWELAPLDPTDYALLEDGLL